MSKALSHRIVVSHFHIFSIIRLFSWDFTVASVWIHLTGPPYLPAPSVATGTRIQCLGYPKESFERELSSTPSSSPASATIRHATSSAFNSHPTTQATSPCARVLRRRPAEAFLTNRSMVLLQNTEPIILGPPLISIGPHTDAILDRFKLGDKTLLKLHILMTTIHSSQWEENLCSPRWDLNYEKVSKLNWALPADLKLGSPFDRVSRDHLYCHFQSS